MTSESKSALQLAGMVITALTLAGTLAQAEGRQPLPGHIPHPAPSLTPIARLDATNQLTLAICLPLRHTNELCQLIEEIYNPASPSFRRYLSADEFARRFGPSTEDYAALSAFCSSNGLAVAATHPNRTILDVAAPASVIEHVFHTTLRVYQHPTDSRNFYAPETEPSIDLATPVLRVQGLDDFTRPRALYKRVPVGARGQLTPSSGSGTNSSYMGNDFRLAYAPGVTLTGSGQTLGLVEFDGYYPSDITAYEKLANLPAVFLQNVLVDSFNGKPGSGNGEVALDIQMAVAMAPGLKKIIIYETTNSSSSSYTYDLLNRIATDNAARQISSSWLGGTYDSALDQIFQQYAAQGQSFFQAAGDSGAYQGTVDAPADDPYITVVGGTTLSTSGGAWGGETVWNDDQGDSTGGGYSTIYALPAWQSGISMAANGGSISYRNLPDVAMIADDVFSISDNGQGNELFGTSIAAPLWAAFTALINQQAATNGQPNVGFLNPALYAIGKGGSYLNAFHDISSGDNATRPGNGFSAVTGYDLCTGWGTPTGSNTINQLLAVANQIDHFAWGAINSPVPTNTPFSVKLTAQTVNNTVATSFNDTVTLSATQSQTNTLFERDFETGDLSDWTDQGGLYTHQIDSTTGAAGTRQSLTLIGGDGTNAYNGLAHSLPNLSPEWVVFYVKSANNTKTSGYFVAGQAAYRSNSVFHFRMNGDGTMGMTDGDGNFYSTNYIANQWYKIALQLDWTNKTVDYYVNDGLVTGNIPFCNTSLNTLAVINLYNFDHTQAWWDQISLLQTSNSPIALAPATSGTFADGTWSGSVTLMQSGTRIALTATDRAGHIGTSNPFDAGGTNNASTTNTVTLTVLASPSAGGTVTGGGVFPVGSLQTLTVTPNSGWFFSHWQDTNYQNPRTIIVPAADIAYTAIFASNSTATIKGTYSGLFFQSNAVAQQSAGGFILNVAATRAFSGTLQNGGTRFSLSGKFDINGHATITNRPHSLTPLVVDLHLDLLRGTDRLSGTVSNSSWTSQLAGDRAIFNAKTNPAPQAGRYTLFIPGSPDSATEPAGDGFATVTINSSGQVSLAGSLSEGTKFSQSSLLSKYGQWPLYVSLYSGQGSILSWITVTNPPEDGLGGDIVWIKPSSSAKYYRDRFTIETNAFGSFYSQPAKTGRVLNFTNAALILIGGNLLEPLTNYVTLTNNSRVLSTNKSSLTFNLTSGTFRGRALNAAKKSISFSGVALTNANIGSGYFLDTNLSGRVLLQGH